MRAREPDYQGVVERDGVRVGYDVYGAGEPTIILLTSWAITHARQWKGQVPYLARHFRVITVEGRGNGRADRPETEEAYTDQNYVDDAIAAMDAAGVDRAVVIGSSLGARHALQLAAWYPERAAGVVAIGPALVWPFPPDFDEPKDSYEGGEKVNRHYWLADYRGFVEFFMSQVFTEPHSIKQWEDGVGFGLETTAETLLLTVPAAGGLTEAEAEAICRQVRCPVLVVHGDQDGIVPYEVGVAVAQWTGGQMVTFHGGGHAPTATDPVRANLLIRSFAGVPGPGDTGPADLDPGPGSPPAGAVRQLADRARARPPRPGHRRRTAGPAPGPGDRLAHSASGDPRARGAGRAGPPGVALAGQRERAPRVRGRRARPERVPGRPPDGRDPGGELHGLPRPGLPTSRTTCGSPTRAGTSTTSCSTTPSSSGPRTRGSPTLPAGCRCPKAAPPRPS